MALPKLRTVPDELLPLARAIHNYYTNIGYRVRSEVADPAAPFTPTFTAKRASTTIHLDVVSSVDLNRIQEWVAFAKSAGSDTRVALCLPPDSVLSLHQDKFLRARGVGVYLAGPTVTEIIGPVDLGVNFELPSISSLPVWLKELLGPAYEKCGKGEWREGFEEACNALEEEARRYLKRWSRSGRIKVSSRRGPHQMSVREVNSLPMGALRDRFQKILSPTHLDSIIVDALTKLNPDRIARVHRRRDKRTEARLRNNVGKHMWLIVSVMKRMR